MGIYYTSHEQNVYPSIVVIFIKMFNDFHIIHIHVRNVIIIFIILLLYDVDNERCKMMCH